MKLEFSERRKFPTNNGTDFASFPVAGITITDEESEDLQVCLQLCKGISGAVVGGMLISKKRIQERVGEEYIGFDVHRIPSKSDMVVLKEDPHYKQGINIRNTLDVLVETKLIHQDTANEILTCQELQDLISGNATRPSIR